MALCWRPSALFGSKSCVSSSLSHLSNVLRLRQRGRLEYFSMSAPVNAHVTPLESISRPSVSIIICLYVHIFLRRIEAEMLDFRAVLSKLLKYLIRDFSVQ